MKKIFALLLCASILICTLALPSAAEGLAPEITSDNCIAVINVNNKQLVYTQKADEAIAPTASAKLTSMMVVYDLLIRYNIPLDTEIQVAQAALRGIGSAGDLSTPSIALDAESKCKISDLIAASLVANANDACSAICYYCATELLGGTLEDFVMLMNAKAKEAGANDTKYRNCTGMDVVGMTTTAADTARITSMFYSYNTLVEYSNQASFRMSGGGMIHAKNYMLSDRIVADYKNNAAIGMIAGQRTNTADYCLITASKTKDDIVYVFVVMNAASEIRNVQDGTRTFGNGSAYNDMNTLIPWATSSFSYITFATQGELLDELKVNLGKNFDYVQVVTSDKLELLVNKELNSSVITHVIEYDTEKVYKGDYNGTEAWMVDAPVAKGDVLGKCVYYFDGNMLGYVEIIASSSVESSGLLTFVAEVRDFLFSDTAKTIITWIIILASVFAVYSITSFVIRSILASRRKKSADKAQQKRIDASSKRKEQ